MGFWNWKYTATDIADWLDAEDEKRWREHDDWLIETERTGESHPVFVFASWFGDRMNTLPQRAMSFVAGGVVDVLRLGNDIDFDSKLGIAKGAFLNVTRLATIAGPISEAVGFGGRYAGILATSKLTDIAGADSPCTFVAINNVLSYLRGRSVQLFAVVEDIVRVAGSNTSMSREALLGNSEVQAALAKYGVTWEQLSGMNTIDDVLRAAQSSDGPITFGIQWYDDGFQAHALTAVKDADGILRILDYVEEGVKGFKGFASMAELAAARPQWGPGIAHAILASKPVIAFSGRYLRLLHFLDGTFRFGLPIAMGLQWKRGRGPSKLFDIARSAWRFLKSKLDDKAPKPPTPTELPQPAATPEPIPSTPDATGNRLGVSPLPAEAAAAPRIDWLTGVQYRLKFLGYYRGAVHGQNDHPTKLAVLDFQTDWFDDPMQWDEIPGPITQHMLYSVVGW